MRLSAQLISALVATLAVIQSGCLGPFDANRSSEPMTILRVYDQDASDPVLAGQIYFENGAATRLEPSADPSASKRFSEAWEAVRGLAELPLAMTKTRIINGEEIQAYGHKMIRPGDDNFPWAVHDYLEKKFRFRVEIDTGK